MDLIVGMVLATAVVLSATGIGLDRDQALYPAAMIVIASYYVLFAVMAGSTHAQVVETAIAALFVAAAIASFKSSLWVVVGALALHGVFDFFHGNFIENAGVPAWWPAFCLAFDVVAAGYLAWSLLRKRVPPLAGVMRTHCTSRLCSPSFEARPKRGSMGPSRSMRSAR